MNAVIDLATEAYIFPKILLHNEIWMIKNHNFENMKFAVDVVTSLLVTGVHNKNAL